MQDTQSATQKSSEGHTADKLYMESNLLRIAGALFCHDQKTAGKRTAPIELNSGVIEKHIVIRPCCRRWETIQNAATKRTSGSQPSTSVVEYGWVTSPVKAGLRPPPPAADGLDRACHPAFVCHQAFDGIERLKPQQRPCRLFRVRRVLYGF
jgi:hypothetical protein